MMVILQTGTLKWLLQVLYICSRCKRNHEQDEGRNERSKKDLGEVLKKKYII